MNSKFSYEGRIRGLLLLNLARQITRLAAGYDTFRVWWLMHAQDKTRHEAECRVYGQCDCGLRWSDSRSQRGDCEPLDEMQ